MIFKSSKQIREDETQLDTLISKIALQEEQDKLMANTASEKVNDS